MPFGMRKLSIPPFPVGHDDKIEVIRSTPIAVKKSNLDECIEVHPWGVAFEDQNKFKLKKDT